MIKKWRNIFFLVGFIAFVISVFFSFQFKKDSLKKQAQLSSTILQSLITLKHQALKRHITQLSRLENNLQAGRGLKQSATLSQNSIVFLALLDLKKTKPFSWFIFNSDFNLEKQKNHLLAQSILKQTKHWLNKNQNLNNTNSKLFVLRVLNKDYFALLTAYGSTKTALWSLALLPKLSFASWLPMQAAGSPFFLLNSFSQIISHNNYFYIAKKSKTNWAVKQSQLGLLESHRFAYQNSDFAFQIFSKIEASSLVLSSTWKLNFWPLFFQLFIVFFSLFFILPYFICSVFFKTKHKQNQNFVTPKPTTKPTPNPETKPIFHPESNPKPAVQKNQDLLHVQNPLEPSAIIKDLQSLIQDLDTKPLDAIDPIDTKDPALFADKTQEL